MIAGNLEKIRQEYTWQQVTRQYEAYFFKCLNREETVLTMPERSHRLPDLPDMPVIAIKQRYI
jgi:hypothetical protein